MSMSQVDRMAGWPVHWPLECVMLIEGESRSRSMLLDANQKSVFLLSQTHRSIWAIIQWLACVLVDRWQGNHTLLWRTWTWATEQRAGIFIWTGYWYNLCWHETPIVRRLDFCSGWSFFACSESMYSASIQLWVWTRFWHCIYSWGT